MFTFAMTRGAVRFASMLIFVLVLNTGLMTVLANIVVPRYVSPVSAFYACQSGLFVFAVLVGMWRLFQPASMSLSAGQTKR